MRILLGNPSRSLVESFKQFVEGLWDLNYLLTLINRQYLKHELFAYFPLFCTLLL